MSMKNGLAFAGLCVAGAGAAKLMTSSAAVAGDNYPPKGLSEGVRKLPQWIQAGCGDKEYFCPEKGALFPASFTPDEMPDLSQHTNFMAETLREHPEAYQKYKDVYTSNGVSLAKCIKTGVDNPGHPMIKTCGIVAGDEESYTVFADVFEPIVSARHGGYPRNAKHPTNMKIEDVLDTKIDPTGKYVLTSRVRTGRSVRGIRLPPSIGFDERRELERVCVKGLLNLKGVLKGDYYPLHGSMSYQPKVGGMSEQKEEELRKAGNLFQEPDSTLLLSSGMGRHWPDARGIYHNNAQNFFVWVGEEDHLRIVSMQKGDDIKDVFKRFATACNEVQKVLKSEGYDFMYAPTNM
ncbi:Creatine kinase [Diplonema papillatum]|nr:Creatine kinase [Diplonema papillatum]